jgi:hypothetical protein
MCAVIAFLILFMVDMPTSALVLAVASCWLKVDPCQIMDYIYLQSYNIKNVGLLVVSQPMWSNLPLSTHQIDLPRP